MAFVKQLRCKSTEIEGRVVNSRRRYGEHTVDHADRFTKSATGMVESINDMPHVMQKRIRAARPSHSGYGWAVTHQVR